jgi:hypothetical protein
VFVDNRLTSIFIGSCVTSIGNNAFGDNNNMLSFTIGANVILLGGEWRGWSLGMQARDDAYNNNNRMAGTYTTADGKSWRYSARR